MKVTYSALGMPTLQNILLYDKRTCIISIKNTSKKNDPSRVVLKEMQTCMYQPSMKTLAWYEEASSPTKSHTHKVLALSSSLLCLDQSLFMLFCPGIIINSGLLYSWMCPVHTNYGWIIRPPQILQALREQLIPVLHKLFQKIEETWVAWMILGG